LVYKSNKKQKNGEGTRKQRISDANENYGKFEQESLNDTQSHEKRAQIDEKIRKQKNPWVDENSSLLPAAPRCIVMHFYIWRKTISVGEVTCIVCTWPSVCSSAFGQRTTSADRLQLSQTDSNSFSREGSMPHFPAQPIRHHAMKSASCAGFAARDGETYRKDFEAEISDVLFFYRLLSFFYNALSFFAFLTDRCTDARTLTLSCFALRVWLYYLILTSFFEQSGTKKSHTDERRA
jgi:hypothetical protein